MKIKEIVWDWNGTLINDTSLCVEILNKILFLHDQASISIEYYRNNFSFPVSAFYKKISLPSSGKKFDDLSLCFISEYRLKWKECNLQPGVLKVLKMIQQLGLRQSILSAGNQSDVELFVDHFKLESFFNQVFGTDNIKAEGKIELGKKFITDSNFKAEEILLVGDTIHDLQVANEIGCSVLLFSQGHNSNNQLSGYSVQIINDLMEVTKYLQY
ncbi:MAG: HAD hydrolase-like protein [Verrucomicrobiota bacterium]|nr:HAD hydrolase-like protein [Verrucomicrobiota bacterium]